MTATGSAGSWPTPSDGDPGTRLRADDVRDVGDAWALYDRLGRQNPGYGDTAAAHLARTMLEAFR